MLSRWRYTSGRASITEKLDHPAILQTCMCMYTCTLLCVHDRYRDNATLMKAHKSNDTLVRPLEELDRSRHTISCNESHSASQSSLFKERRLGNHSRALAKIGVRIRRERGGCKTLHARTGQRPCRCFTANLSVRGSPKTYQSILIMESDLHNSETELVCASATTTRLDSIYRFHSSRPQAAGKHRHMYMLCGPRAVSIDGDHKAIDHIDQASCLP